MDDRLVSFQLARDDPDRVVLEGFHAVKHALRFGAEVEALFSNDRSMLLELAARLAPDLSRRFASVVEVDDRDWAAMGAATLPTPVLGLAARPDQDSWRETGPRVLLEDPRHLGNLGACVRVAAAAGAAAVFTTGDADPWHPSAIRAAAGLHFAIRVERLGSLAQLDGPVVAVDPGGAPLGERRFPGTAVYAFGTERHGLSDDVITAASDRVAIPMRDGVSSLNLATAVAVVLYHHRGVVR